MEHISYMRQSLKKKYSSASTYYYTKKINEIIDEKRTNYNIIFEDLECLCDDDEYLKRIYEGSEYIKKMSGFKEYYFYHEDCPRILMKKIELIYEKWQDKKRDFLYKKLKLMYDESMSSLESTSRSIDSDEKLVSHFLFDISQFNPYSKNYYLRVKARRQKEEEQKKKKVLHTQVQLSSLNHNISSMLKNINDISSMSRVSCQPAEEENFRSSHKKVVSLTLSPPVNKHENSLPKLNFKKSKNPEANDLKNRGNLKIMQQFKMGVLQHQELNVSPKIKSKNHQGSLNSLKTKSIFSISSFGVNKSIPQNLRVSNQINLKAKNQQKQIENLVGSKKTLKIKESKSLGKKPSPQVNNFKIQLSSLKQLNFKPDEFSDQKFILKADQNQKQILDKIRTSNTGSVTSTGSTSTMKKKFNIKSPSKRR